tara:strand:- start:3367 stop:3585 length:219 start_codon:yes stop_codon:yes gene_type:complete
MQLPPRADQDSVQMLQRSSQVGEFYRMSPPEVFDEKKVLPQSYMGAPLHSQHMPYTACTVFALGQLRCLDLF